VGAEEAVTGYPTPSISAKIRIRAAVFDFGLAR